MQVLDSVFCKELKMEAPVNSFPLLSTKPTVWEGGMGEGEKKEEEGETEICTGKVQRFIFF